jgi:outer membrane immunogenic protein
MKKLLMTAAVTFLTATGAQAADLAARPYTKAPALVAAVYDWSGFYIGANGGWGSSHNCSDAIRDGAGPIVPALVFGCHDATGGTAGGQVGYRWQASNWVFGVEAQGNWAEFRGSNENLFFPGFREETRIDAFGLFTGQIGYAWNNVLLYLKGGAAVVEDKYQGVQIATGIPFSNARETRWGGVVGVGLEYGFAPNWSVAFEYDHMFMGTRDVDFYTAGNLGPVSYDVTRRIPQDVDLATVRINYRWGGPVIAKY